MELFWTTKLRFKLGVMPYSQHKLTSTEVYLGMKLPYKLLNTEKKSQEVIRYVMYLQNFDKNDNKIHNLLNIKIYA